MNDLIRRSMAIDAIVFNLEDRFAVDVLNDVPAVDAVPVEWLREKTNNNNFVIGRAARFILHAWEQEQEAR